MARSRSFSIYLLKPGFDSTNALKDDHPLIGSAYAANLPDNAVLFILNAEPKPPWWRAYFGIRKPLIQALQGALMFIPVGNRRFALTFGHVAHFLKEESYEYDFGLKVTLNSVDPAALKSTDALEPGLGRRQRTQVPIGSDLTLFDFDHDSSILRRLTGKVKPAHADLFKNATGASNLRISTKVPPEQLVDLCRSILTLYESEAYKDTFPDIQNVAPVKDPTIIQQLDTKLVAAVRQGEGAELIVPEMLDFNRTAAYRFSGEGKSEDYEDLFTGSYYDYLDQRDFDRNRLSLTDLKKQSLLIVDENGDPLERHSIYKSLVFDTKLGRSPDVFHLSEGNWYKVENTFIAKLQNELDALYENTDLPDYEHDDEGAYNAAVAESDESRLCLDKTSIAPAGETAVEPCDIYSVENGHAVFDHVKISTLSSKLSHLFNQGVNAVELLIAEKESTDRLKEIIKKGVPAASLKSFLKPIDEGKRKVRFVMITHKEGSKKSNNLPLFSRISLRRSLRALKVMSVVGAFTFVKDASTE
jgi:uncharacterized protein (TIGR04141 family)